MKSRLVLVLLAVILVPSVALAWLGVRTYRSESDRARAGLRERAEQAVDAVHVALADELGRLQRAEGEALALRFDGEGRLVAPLLERPLAQGPSGPEDAALYRYLEAEVDRLEVSGEPERLAARLREIGAREGDPWLSAWAWSTLGAIERRAGREDEARAAWGELIARHPGVRDERGLVRAFAARRFLAAGEKGDAARLALYADVVADHVAGDELATRLFKAELAAELVGSRGLDDLLRLDQERERVRRLRTAWRDGIADWIARGAPGTALRFEDWLVAAARADDASVEGRGGAVELERFVAATLQRPELTTFAALGFTTRVTGEALAATEPAPPPAGVSLSQRDLAAPFSGLVVSVLTADMEGLLQSERRGFLLAAGLVTLAVLFSLVAGLATVRAIGREVEAARGREAFVAAVTHELKAPLASIRLLGEVLGEGGVEERKVREFGQRTAAEAERLSGVITSVLELARLQHENGAPAHASADLVEIARAALGTFEPLARARGFAVELRAPAQPLNLRADAQALEGAVLNLLDNALKYSDAPHTIEVELAVGAERATLTVLDRGRGVAPEDAGRIFEPFRRVGDELTRDRPGVGLGLALVQRIARAHGGDARYAPRAGGGSCFVIELPV